MAYPKFIASNKQERSICIHGKKWPASHLLVTMEQNYLLKLSAAYKHTGRSCGPRSDCHLHQVVLKIVFIAQMSCLLRYFTDFVKFLLITDFGVIFY